MSQVLTKLADALGRRGDHAPDPNSRHRAEQLRRHVAEYLVPRAADLNAPLVVVLLGSTGAGKSSLFNAIAGRKLSDSGLIRPTTRRPVALAHPDDAEAVTAGVVFPGLPARQALEVKTDNSIAPGLVIVDAPDFDSVETANRQLATELLEAADLVVFITTVTRYADQVPWTVLARARQRGVPLLAILNRMPVDSPEASAVLADYRALLERGDLDQQGVFGRLEVVVVPEGALDQSIDGLDRGAVAQILEAMERLRADREQRRDLARRSLGRALQGLPAAVEKVAAEIDSEQKAAEKLIEVLKRTYGSGRKAVTSEIEGGSFLRSEVLRQWLEYVNAGPVARFLSEGVGRIAAGLRNLWRANPPSPAPAVREAAFSDLVASTVRHADTSARRAATAWMEERHGSEALATDPSLWGASPDLAVGLQTHLQEWAEEIGAEIRTMGSQRKGRALAASVGLNVLGTSAILAVFIHTGGLTGAELGIGAATAVINQKLLETIFGEANVAAFVNRARLRLDAILDESFNRERERFLTALGQLATPTDLAAELRALAHQATRVMPL